MSEPRRYPYSTSLIAIILSTFLVAACDRETGTDVVTATSGTIVSADPQTSGDAASGLNAPASTTNAEALRASAGEVIRNSAQYTGRVVTVTGDVDRVYSPRAFTLDGGITAGQDLLVLSRTPVPGVVDAGRNRAFLSGDDAIVTGRILTLAVPEIEREIGWDLDRQIEIDFERRPLLIIETVSVTPDAAKRSGT